MAAGVQGYPPWCVIYQYVAPSHLCMYAACTAGGHVAQHEGRQRSSAWCVLHLASSSAPGERKPQAVPSPPPCPSTPPPVHPPARPPPAGHAWSWGAANPGLNPLTALPINSLLRPMGLSVITEAQYGLKVRYRVPPSAHIGPGAGACAWACAHTCMSHD